jgi:hypothetical protein
LLEPELEAIALLIPSAGECQPLEPVRSQLDRVPAIQDGFDDIRVEEGERERAADLGLVSAAAKREFPNRRNSPFGQLIDPGMGVREQRYQLGVRRRGLAMSGLYHQFRLRAAPPQLDGKDKADQHIRWLETPGLSSKPARHACLISGKSSRYAERCVKQG